MSKCGRIGWCDGRKLSLPTIETLLIAVVITLTLGTGGVLSPYQIWHPVYGQDDGENVEIKTSADSHDHTFFGQGILQIVVTDSDAEDDSAVETVIVDVEAKPDIGSSDSISIEVPETSDSSGRFEFFLAHVASTIVDPGDLDAINTAGVEGDGTCIEDCAPFVTFGPSGDIHVNSDLYDDVRFEITKGDKMIVVEYEETFATLSLDREIYGSSSFVHVFVNDQDANLNPFERDEFMVDPENLPNDDLFILSGGQIVGNITFKETRDNSASFEGRYLLGSSMEVDTKSLTLTVYDKANYGAGLASPENDSNNTDEVGFGVGNSDGKIIVDDGGDATGGLSSTWDPVFTPNKNSSKLGDNIYITIMDQDANRRSDAIDEILVQINSSSSGSQEIELSAIETGENTGLFELTFTIVTETNEGSSEIGAKEGDTIIVKYTDNRPADYSERIQSGLDPQKDFALRISVSDARVGLGAVNMTMTMATDLTGQTISKLISNQQVVLSTTINNNIGDELPFVAIIEVRNSDGVTIYLAWQTGVLNPNGRAEVGLSWTPEESGDYDIRTFAISDFVEVRILSQVGESKIIVGS